MGQAKIISNLGRGAYTVEIVKDVDRIDEAVARCDKGVSDAESAKIKAEQAEANARAEIVAAGEALDAAIRAANGSSTDAAVKAAQDRLDKAAWALEDAQQAVALAKLKAQAFEDERKTYDGVTASDQRDTWCTDATDDLEPGATVGTVEINQEAAQILVAPGGEDSDTILQPGMANDGVATYLNWGLLPGVQRWKPTYRVGTIKEIDYETDTAMVCLDDARSSAQSIKINPDGVECETQKDGPQGFVEFCGRNPGHPACTANGSTKLGYSSDLMATLTEINKRINRDNSYSYDSAQYGKLENWEEMPQSGGRGDCEDFALAKYRACLNAGIPASALKLATGKTSNGQGHAWLEVQTDNGNVALDLNTQAATLSDDLPYSGRAVQADGTNWSGKGLLLEDVPVEYMECNAGAFKKGDRVVVHFKDSDWSKPRVIGFEEAPQPCGDIICLFWKDGAYRASRLSFVESAAGTSVSVKAGTPVEATQYVTIPEAHTIGSYFKSFSKKILIDDKEFYLFAVPATEEDFIFGTAFDYMNDDSSKINKQYFQIYDPSKGKKTTIPIESYGILGMYSTWNYHDGWLYCNKLNSHENNYAVIVDVVFQAIKISLDDKGEIAFGDVVSLTVNNEEFNAEYGQELYHWDYGFVSDSGVFKLLWIGHGARGYGDLQAKGIGVCTINVHTGAIDYSADGGVWNGPVLTCIDSGEDGFEPHYGVRSRDGDAYEMQLGNKKFSWISDVSEGEPGAGVWTHVNAYCKALKIPMGNASYSFDKESFYSYFKNTTKKVLGTGTLISDVVSNKMLCTPYGDIEIDTQLDGTKDVYGMAHIERQTGNKFRAVVGISNSGGFGFYAWHNKLRVDGLIASALGVDPKYVIGFLHRPRS